MRFLRVSTAAIFLALVVPLAATAAVAPKIELTLTGTIAVADGAKTTFAPLDRPVKSGETIRYTIVAKNRGTAAAVGLTPVGNIPEQFAFERIVAAPPTARPEYTLDGKTWSAQPTIVVKDAGGKERRVPAPFALYRAVHWILGTSLDAGKSQQFVYEVRVK